MAGAYIAFMATMLIGLSIDYAAQFRPAERATTDHLEETR